MSFFEGLELRIRGQRNPAEVAYIGGNLFTSGWHQEAFEFLQKAVKEFPDDPEIRLLYATILLAFQTDKVVAEVAKAVELGPDNPAILARAAGLMIGREEIEAARSYAVRARELVPPDFALMAGLENTEGSLAYFDGDYVRAEEKLRSAVARQPENEHFARELAVFLAERGRLEDAIEVLGEALKHVKADDELERMRARMAAEVAARRRS
jgi:Flp pilus assembly protein TadD